jgi:hypothetical protein
MRATFSTRLTKCRYLLISRSETYLTKCSHLLRGVSLDDPEISGLTATVNETEAATMTPSENPAKYLKRAEFAKWFGELVRGKPYSPFTLMTWQKDGRGPPAIRIGRDVIYNTDTAEEWLASLSEDAAA